MNDQNNKTTVETLVEGKYYRVINILSLRGFSDRGAEYEALPLRDGCMIEERRGDYYETVAVLHWENGEVVLEDVNFRSVETIREAVEEQREEYFTTLDFARTALRDVNE